MKKIRLTLFIILITKLVLAQTYENDTSVVYKQFLYKNGTVASEGYLNNNKPTGFWRSYYQTGVLKSEGKWTNNKLDSVWIFYDQLGDTIEKINYYRGKKNGYHYKFFNDNEYKNTISSKELYVDGTKNGETIDYYKTREVLKSTPYVNNLKQGVGYEFNKAGNIITIFRYRRNEIIDYELINRYDKENRRVGVWKEFYSNGNIKEEINYVDGKLNGYRKIYDQFGKLVDVYYYKNGEVDLTENDFESNIDIKEEFDKNDNLVFRGSFKNKKPIGVHRFFNIKGEVVNSKTYDIDGNLIADGIVLKNGWKNGDWIYYYTNKNKQAEGKYVNGKKHGKWIYYYDNKKIQQTGSYSNGKFNGNWKWYYKTGELLKDEYYLYGKPDGESIEYDIYGNVITKGNYIDGLKEGNWNYVIGDQKYSGNYVMGEKDGEWESYFLQEETLSFKGNYIRGREDGKHTYFYPDGHIMDERYYDEGEKVKSWSKYDEYGNLIIVVQYKNGNEYRINGVRVNLQKEEK